MLFVVVCYCCTRALVLCGTVPWCYLFVVVVLCAVLRCCSTVLVLYAYYCASVLWYVALVFHCDVFLMLC